MAFTIRRLASMALVFCSCYLTSALVVLPQAPKPTSPPRLRDVEHIYERADGPVTETLSVVVASDSTCGTYPAGIGGFYCKSVNCMFETSKYSVAFCPNHGFKTTCINNFDALNTEKCDDDCKVNANIEKCSKSGYSNIVFPSGFEDLPETSLNITIYPAAVTASSTEASSTEASRTETSSTELSGEATSTGPTTTTTSESQDEGGGGSKSNTGAIAGGVVGGVVGLAGLGLAIFLIVRRNKKNKKKQQQQTPAEMADQSTLQPQMPYGMTPEQQQRWSTTSQSPQGWKSTDSPSVPPSQSPQVLVEAPDGTAAQVHELDGGRGNRR
ncbi:hypothetical protein FLONG3_5577 [Fusarium longipes]|uniref:Uncharacterized protein n=1 Tax=Fusarium longipes TaxID=694270 RepID=A0A395STJ8_9HYPO|nr:hypothetical protein FLONG3_5577 [Fusarium longipes]